jgi:hypothetical protein
MNRSRLFWRIAASGLMSLALLAVTSLNIAGAQPASGNHTSGRPVQIPISGKGIARMVGIVDLSKAPTIKAGAQVKVNGPTPPRLDPLTPQQRAAYLESLKHATNLPSGSGISSSTSSGIGPNFVGGGGVPLLTKNVDGLTSDQGSDPAFDPPNPVVAADLSYVMEAAGQALAIYRTSTGALAYGPYTLASFFTPLSAANHTFMNAQMVYDVMRDRWIVSATEYTGTSTFLDLAVSVSTSPTQPAPGAQYRIYQIATSNIHGADPKCFTRGMGVEYYSITITCDASNGAFTGNETIVFDKAPLLTGAPANYYLYSDVMLDNAHPAYDLTPATEDGVQDAEFLIATGAGWGGPGLSSTICALGNLPNISGATPALTCSPIVLGVPYNDPPLAREPGGLTFNPGYGVGQVSYKAGKLYFALTLAVGSPGAHDGIFWAAVQPWLAFVGAPLNYSVINGISQKDVAIVASNDQNVDFYAPSVIGADENDIGLLFMLSGVNLYPSIGLTGRRATDDLGVMGRGSFSLILLGASPLSGPPQWGRSGSCAVLLNSVTRGTVWCALQYAGAKPWNTRLVAYRLE